MTLALIVLAVFAGVCITQSAIRKNEIKIFRKRTITNIPLQDELSTKNFTLVVNELRKIDLTKTLLGDALIDAIESLYVLFDVPDRRTDSQKLQQRQSYHNHIKLMRNLHSYPANDSALSLAQRIWCNINSVPDIEHPSLFIGIPNTVKEVNGIVYRYDFRGIAAHVYNTLPAKLIGDIKVLLTTRDLDSMGFKYSWNRLDSCWQRSEADAKKYNDKKTKYPWLYR